jgi:hypothetical protein
LCPTVNNIINNQADVNKTFNRDKAVNYKDATDRLFERITAEDLAAELSVSQNAVARARLDPSTRGYRPAPSGWEQAVARLAEIQANRLLALKREIEALIQVAKQ